LLHDLLRLAKDRGFEKFDLSVGTERYKHEWSDTELKLYDHVSAANLRGACAMLPSVARRQAKHWIKSNPSLWDFYRKACVYAGSLRGVRH
jgi:CelD/BcsL family acetyltransferase involved in cellulose biosynthesis